MIFEGGSGAGKTSALVKKYVELVNSGVSPDKILVLVQNSAKRKNFIDATKRSIKCGAYSKFNIYTFFGLCYNSVLDFWPLVEAHIKDPNAQIEPNMCGLEVSQHIFKKCVEKAHFKGYNSKINLLHQLLRRYSLIVQNALSDKEVQERAKMLKESFTQEAFEAINMYKSKTLSLRAFDYLRQVGVFSHIYKIVENAYEYVFLDDGDEIAPACFEYLKHIKPSVKEFFVAYDKRGSSRLGYLSAQVVDFPSFLGEVPCALGTESHAAQEIFENVRKNKPVSLSRVGFSSFIRRDEMVDEVILKINSLLKKGAKPSEIAVVTPCTDGYLKYF
ncbi:uvrD/REP helicase [Candidatus Gastranaerophilus sp. (ex Termes propinquus)]|nr:uvrD/REP helicase [Candidatus Gastranaerophilus sp. (ex Termes propinquus)]